MYRAYGTPYSLNYLLFYKYLMPLASFRNAASPAPAGQNICRKGNTRESPVRVKKLIKAKTLVRTEQNVSCLRHSILLDYLPFYKYLMPPASFRNRHLSMSPD